jgi:hypothetical protein
MRGVATWLGRAAEILGPALPLYPRVRAVLAALRATIWLAKNLPEIFSYLDEAKTLEELRGAVEETREGYEVHHIVEAQSRSRNPLRNSLRFADRIHSSENLVRIPKWKHVEISSWYSTKNEFYNGLTPRQYLCGKSWSEQYEFGLQVLRDFGLLK